MAVSVSTVTPVYRGAQYLPDLVAALAALRASWEAADGPLRLEEAIFVDDASSDGSADVLSALAAEHDWMSVVTLSRNFGQHPATIAGVLHSAGDWVVSLDEDLQHRPENIPEMLLAATGRGSDIVYARPRGRVHGGGLRDLSSRAFKGLMARATGNPMFRLISSFRVMRGPIARAAASVCSHETYFDVALGWFSDRYATVELTLLDERHRSTGQSGYSFGSLLSHARRFFVSSQAKTLRFGAGLGMLAMLAALVLGVRLIVLYALDPGRVEVQGWNSLFVSILFFGGITSCLLGVALEYLSNVVLHVQGKPPFFVVDRSADARVAAFLGERGAHASPD